MRQLINKKIYNTDKAQEVASYSYSNYGDFHFIEEILYKTKKGNLFIYGKGGPLTEYATKISNTETGGASSIIPVNSSEALEWIESRNIYITERILDEFSDLLESVWIAYLSMEINR